MSRPAKPVAGTEIRHELAADLAAYARDALEFVRLPHRGAVRWDVEGATGTGSAQTLELTRLPANDPRIRYAYLLVVLRGASAGDNASLQLLHGDTSTGAFMTYNTGTANVGGLAGPAMVRVGGARGRSVGWTATATVSRVWVSVLGYWRTPA